LGSTELTDRFDWVCVPFVVRVVTQRPLVFFSLLAISEMVSLNAVV
jgi:hypothetical protein